MKYLYIIIVLFMLPINMGARKMALIIGISQYPNYSGWNTIHSDNDVQLLHQTLSSDLQLRILQNESATKKNILDELGGLYDAAKMGDSIFVFFSGHGQLMINPQKDNYLDESIVPFDACINPVKDRESELGEYHIRDTEYGKIIERLRKKVGKQGLVISVIDACHSDSMDKGETSLPQRGVKDIFGYSDELSDSIKAYRSHIDSLNIASDENIAEVMYFAACGSWENNNELFNSNDNKYYGRLIWAICQEYRKQGFSDMTSFMEAINNFSYPDMVSQSFYIRTSLKNTNTTVPSSPINMVSYVIRYLTVFIIILFIITTVLIFKISYNQGIRYRKIVEPYLRCYFFLFNNRISNILMLLLILYLVYSLIKLF